MSHLPSRCDLVLKNVLLPSGRTADVSVHRGRVCHTGSPISADISIECRGRLAIPAGVDMHVHMRGWSQSAKEDWNTGSLSAIAGGVTVVVDQPNTIPPLDAPGSYRERVQDGLVHSNCSFAVNGGVSPKADLEGLWNAGAMSFGEIFAAPSSYGQALDSDLLARALSRIGAMGALATIHAEEVAPGPDCSLTDHDRLRPERGEAAMVREVERMACPAGAELHFCHLSCPESVKAVTSGSVEVAPHHLLLSRDTFSPQDTWGKVNPPLREEKTRRGLLSCWDRIDVIASDHAPHTRGEKADDFDRAPSGIPGVETMIPLLMAEVKRGACDLGSLITKVSQTPSRLLGIKDAGFSPGDRADFILFEGEISAVNAERLHSRAQWTPYEGMRALFPAVVVMEGEVVYRDCEFFPGHPRWYPGRGYISSMPKTLGADSSLP
ncbi:dihydroorotase [Methanolinea mesophila]|uniref:dihydroorotase n=1 Tax=Methanolinea mesophila TaxID=547055 RepID=UPI001AE74BAB|nr:dihydroorotase [Methanolinea mesophila]MBP1928045.1 dihydroorotase [Methanolinea mesophila]